MCLYVAAFVMPFNFIPCSEKVEFLPFGPQGRGGSTGILFAIVLLHASVPLIYYAT